MSILRDRSYHDLSSGEKIKYDNLIKLSHELRRQKRFADMAQTQKEAREMLGLRSVDTYVESMATPRDRGVDYQSRVAGTSRDYGHQ